MIEEYLTTTEAARLLRYAAKTLRNKIASGTFLEGVHFVQNPGCQKRWRRSALVAWLEGVQGDGGAGGIPLAAHAVVRGRSWE